MNKRLRTDQPIPYNFWTNLNYHILNIDFKFLRKNIEAERIHSKPVAAVARALINYLRELTRVFPQ